MQFESVSWLVVTRWCAEQTNFDGVGDLLQLLYQEAPEIILACGQSAGAAASELNSSFVKRHSHCERRRASNRAR